jgi:beta-glucanase (GH16 family)
MINTPRVGRVWCGGVFACCIAAGVLTIEPGIGAEPEVVAPVPSEWALTWHDEFDGEEIDRSKWDFDIGNGFYDYGANQWINGWGNDELEYYTSDRKNAFVQDGALHICAIKESIQGLGYTSARLKARKGDGSELFNQTYGRFEFRAKLPVGKGLWPALWLLPQHEAYGQWAASGEIDVMEAIGQEPDRILGTLHFGSRWPANAKAPHTYILPGTQSIADFHIYAIEWEPGEMRWYVDGVHIATQAFWWSCSKLESPGRGLNPGAETDLSPWPAPFDQPFYPIMNLAVGGTLTGNPDVATIFPAEMTVDYIRVYEKTGGYKPVSPRGAGPIPFGS